MVHIGVYHVAIFNYQGYLRITVALKKEQHSQHLLELVRERLTFWLRSLMFAEPIYENEEKVNSLLFVPKKHLQ